jgi:hypothetical protein
MKIEYTPEQRAEMNLPTEKICSCCGEMKPANKFGIQKTKPHYRLIAHCKSCASKKSIACQKNQRINDPLRYYPKASWSSMNQRTTDGCYSSAVSVQNNYQQQSYFKKDIRCEITKEEWYQFWADNTDAVLHIISLGGTPSIDRIDSQKNYTLQNIRIISKEKNILLKFPGNEHISDKEAINTIVGSSPEQKLVNRKRYLKSHMKNTEGEK